MIDILDKIPFPPLIIIDLPPKASHLTKTSQLFMIDQLITIAHIQMSTSHQ